MVKAVFACLLACGVLLVRLGAAPVDQEDAAQRTERSANLSHITGTARKIRMYVKNRFLQVLPDGTVNGTGDETEYSILQRQSVRAGQVKIQGVATCIYLCMDSCGLLYGSREFAEDCVFNEMIEQHNYNTYSSTKYSNNRRTVYLALNKKGVARRVQIKAKSPLGKLSAYTRVLTQHVSTDEVEALTRRMMAHHPVPQHHMRHHQLCPPAPRSTGLPETADHDRCRRRKKRRKRRRCQEGEEESEDCHKMKGVGAATGEDGKRRVVVVRKRCEEGEKCQQKKQMTGRKRKSRHEVKRLLRHLDGEGRGGRGRHTAGEDESEEAEDQEHEEEDEEAATNDLQDNSDK